MPVNPINVELYSTSTENNYLSFIASVTVTPDTQVWWLFPEEHRNYIRFSVKSTLNDTTINDYIAWVKAERLNLNYSLVPSKPEYNPPRLFEFTKTFGATTYNVIMFPYALLTNEIIDYCLTLNDDVVIDNACGGLEQFYEVDATDPMCYVKNFSKGLRQVEIGNLMGGPRWRGISWNNFKPIYEYPKIFLEEFYNLANTTYFQSSEAEINAFTLAELQEFCSIHSITLTSEWLADMKVELIGILRANHNIE